LGRERKPALPAGAKNGWFEKSNIAKLKNRHSCLDITNWCLNINEIGYNYIHKESRKGRR
jgi:hypothetical protein